MLAEGEGRSRQRVVNCSDKQTSAVHVIKSKARMTSLAPSLLHLNLFPNRMHVIET
jgi:hypothetical protein